MSDLFFIEVQLEPCVRPSEVLQNAWKAMQKGVKKNNGKAEFCFKVIGENRLLMILEGDPDGPLEELNAECGSQVRVTTSVLRPYLDFADKVLKVEDKTLTTPAPFNLDGEGKLIYMRAVVDYKGMTQKELLDLWREEANTGLGILKSTGGLALYKIVGRLDILAFWRCADYALVDDGTFNLPLYAAMGNQIHVTTKAIKMMEQGK